MALADMIDEGYQPSDDETFMNERQREFFRRKLLLWKDEILRESRETLAALQTENENHADIADRASSETDRAIELRARDRQRKLISKIDAAIARIEDLSLDSLAPLREAAVPTELLVLGCGARAVFVPPDLRATLKAAGMGLEVVDTGSACRIYNVLLAEGRRVAAALIPL